MCCKFFTPTANNVHRFSYSHAIQHRTVSQPTARPKSLRGNKEATRTLLETPPPTTISTAFVAVVWLLKMYDFIYSAENKKTLHKNSSFCASTKCLLGRWRRRRRTFSEWPTLLLRSIVWWVFRLLLRSVAFPELQQPFLGNGLSGMVDGEGLKLATCLVEWFLELFPVRGGYFSFEKWANSMFCLALKIFVLLYLICSIA